MNLILLNAAQWALIHPDYKWAAVDRDGTLVVYKEEPYIGHSDVEWNTEGEYYACGYRCKMDYEGYNWDMAIQEKP